MQSTTHINHADADADDGHLASEHPTEVHTAIPSSGGRELCSNCGAPLAADQHYCIECGQRRGAPRFPFMEGVAQRTAMVEAPPAAVVRPPRFSPNGTLIAGIGTLLLAMGIGVLIGRSGNNSSSKTNAPVQVLTVGGAAGTSGAVGAVPGAGTTSTPGSPTKSAAAAAKTAKATGTSTVGKFQTKAPPPKVVTVGSPGKGPGYQGGKFTGNFFGQ